MSHPGTVQERGSKIVSSSFSGVYAGIKFFIIDFIFKSCPKLRQRYDTPYIIWTNLPTDLQLKERGNIMLSRRVSTNCVGHFQTCWSQTTVLIWGQSVGRWLHHRGSLQEKTQRAPGERVPLPIPLSLTPEQLGKSFQATPWQMLIIVSATASSSP